MEGESRSPQHHWSRELGRAVSSLWLSLHQVINVGPGKKNPKPGLCLNVALSKVKGALAISNFQKDLGFGNKRKIDL